MEFRKVPTYARFRRTLLRPHTYIKTGYNAARMVNVRAYDKSPLSLTEEVIFEQDDEVTLVKEPEYCRFQDLSVGMMFWDPIGKENLFKFDDRYGMTAGGNKSIVQPDAPVFHPRFMKDVRTSFISFKDLKVGEFYEDNEKVYMKTKNEESCNHLGEVFGVSGTVWKLPIVNPVFKETEPERGVKEEPEAITKGEITIHTVSNRTSVTFPSETIVLDEEGVVNLILGLKRSLSTLRFNADPYKDKP